VSSSPDSRLAKAAKQPNSDPFTSSSNVQCQPSRRPLVIIAGLLFALVAFATTGNAQSVWERVAHFIGLHGKPEPASASVLSEHEIAELDNMSPQNQAELLLERSINHYRGANDQIAGVDRWRGKLTWDDRLNSLYGIALDSDDLRVRAAAIEIGLASNNMQKNEAAIDRLENKARFGERDPRMNALWNIALLGNRGGEPQRAFEIVSASIHDTDEFVRSQAVEGLAYLGTDDTIAPLLEIFHDDPSPNIRERAACGLAQSGMLSEKQRRTTVPKLLDFAEDPSLDATTRTWVFQALRDITGQNLPHDAAIWRNWYNSDTKNWSPVTRDTQ